MTFAAMMSILRGVYVVRCLLVEVLGIVEFVYAPTNDNKYDEKVVKRRIALAQVYETLPAYSSLAFWQAVETTTIPLEVLVRCLRDAVKHEDISGRNQLVEIIIRRTQTTNEYWANSVLRDIPVQTDERSALMGDLYADLYESMIRALLDPMRLFWQENFLHCLHFERKHVYRAFMRREGCWNDWQVKKSTRVPRMLVASLDQPIPSADGGKFTIDIEDERAQVMLRMVEGGDLLRLVLRLPDRLKMVVVLLFWEGRSEKETAQVLGITDRTVRNRVRDALKMLRERLQWEEAI